MPTRPPPASAAVRAAPPAAPARSDHDDLPRASTRDRPARRATSRQRAAGALSPRPRALTRRPPRVGVVLVAPRGVARELQLRVLAEVAGQHLAQPERRLRPRSLRV